MLTHEKNNNPTPNGGVRSEAFYFDDNGKPADKKIATNITIVEYDAFGKSIHRTYLTLDKSKIGK